MSIKLIFEYTFFIHKYPPIELVRYTTGRYLNLTSLFYQWSSTVLNDLYHASKYDLVYNYINSIKPLVGGDGMYKFTLIIFTSLIRIILDLLIRIILDFQYNYPL